MRLIRMLRLMLPVLVTSLFFLSFAAYAEGPVLQKKPGVQVPDIANPNAPPKGTITITKPQSGSTWYTGQPWNIQWTCDGTSSSEVTVTLWKDNQLIATIGQSNTGRTAYTVQYADARPGSGGYEIRVTGQDVRVEACQPIFVQRASVHFTSPKAGDKWLFDSQQTITWTYTGDPGPLKLILNSSDHFSEVILASSVASGTGGQGQASVKLPMPPEVRSAHNPYILSAHRMADNVKNGESDSFRIEFPHITVTSPKVGQIFQAGAPTAITWTSEPQKGTVTILLLDSSYKTVDTLSTTTPAQLGNLAWTPSKTLPAGAHSYYINITNPSLILGSDQSQAFTIVGPPVDPLLTGAEAVFNTTSENKDHDTAVYVRLTDKASNKDIASVSGAATSSGDSTEYKSNSRATLRVVYNAAMHKSDCNNFKVTIGSKATGNDTWTFNGTVTLSFADGTQIVKGSTYERVLHSENSQYTEIDLEGPAVPKWPNQSQTTTTAASSPVGKPFQGYTYVGQPTCVGTSALGAMLQIDANGYYCSAYSNGVKSRFQPSCSNYSSGGGSDIGPLVRDGIFYGCYRPNQR